MSTPKDEKVNKHVTDDEEEEEDEAEHEPFEAVTDGREVTFELARLNPYISCSLCNGYLREAHTITECLHSFCKVCIEQWFILRQNRDRWSHHECPRCRRVLEVPDPLKQAVRFDRALQALVDKLLPELAQADDELRNAIFGAAAARSVPVSGKPAAPAAHARPPPAASPLPSAPRMPDPIIIFELRPQQQLHTASIASAPLAPLEKPFLRTSAKMSIRHVKKLLVHRAVIPSIADVDVTCRGEMLGADHSLEFVKKTRWHDPASHMVLLYRRAASL